MKGYKDGDIIPKQVVIDYLKDSYHEDEMEAIFAYHINHPIELVGGRLRWKQTIEYGEEFGNCPNQMGIKVQSGEITQKEHMEYNRQIGYSLYGYWEVYYFNGQFDEEQYEIDKVNNRNDNIKKLLK